MKVTKNYTFNPDEKRSECKICGIQSFAHLHTVGTLPKDFVMLPGKVVEVQNVVFDDITTINKKKCTQCKDFFLGKTVQVCVEHSLKCDLCGDIAREYNNWGIKWNLCYNCADLPMKSLTKISKLAQQKVKGELQTLLTQGHGGGNWRRLINDLIDKL